MKLKKEIEIDESNKTLGDLLPHELYSNDNGTQNDFVLSDSVANYKKIDILAKHWYFNIYKTFTLYDPNNKTFTLDSLIGDDGTLYWTVSNILISGKNVSVGYSFATNTYAWRTASSLSNAFAYIHNDNNVRYKIYKVIGYK